MQESSCNPGTVGGAGEQGLMQITKDKCGGAPGGNCKDVVSVDFYQQLRACIDSLATRTSIFALVSNILLIPSMLTAETYH